jgi:hypothetical protein
MGEHFGCGDIMALVDTVLDWITPPLTEPGFLAVRSEKK